MESVKALFNKIKQWLTPVTPDFPRCRKDSSKPRCLIYKCNTPNGMNYERWSLDYEEAFKCKCWTEGMAKQAKAAQELYDNHKEG